MGRPARRLRRNVQWRQEGNWRGCCDRNQVNQVFREEGVSHCAKVAARRGR